MLTGCNIWPPAPRNEAMGEQSRNGRDVLQKDKWHPELGPEATEHVGG